MERFIKQMSIYHQYHQKLITRISHYIGVPLIVFSLMIVLGWLQFGITEVFTTQLDWLLIAALVIYYLFFEIVIGLSTGVVLVILNVLAGLIGGISPNWNGFWIFLVCFAVGWLFQLLGHVVARNKPAFMNNLSQIFIAPFFLVAEIFFRFGYRKSLRERVHSHPPTTTN
ncbi:MAG: hypothetical protein CMF50_04135 [Legionellales bacterium]|nr:hypothetical protein [Legionellales bacterium]|tara:strand:+ start:12214 stop:12723 length:510 start_codon:yes stop_codon:yes gene_type:complete